MGDSMNCTLINPNQLRHFGTKVQDNPVSDLPLFIMAEDNEFSMELDISGTIIYADTHIPSDNELQTCKHIQLSSSYQWNPHNVSFPKSIRCLEDIVHHRLISVLKSQKCNDIVGRRNDEIIFDFTSAQRRIAGMHTEIVSVNNDVLQRNERIDPGFTDVPTLQTFQSKDRHSDVSPQ